MTSARSVLPVLLCALAAAGCGGQEPPSDLPTFSGTPSTSSPAPTSAAPSQSSSWTPEQQEVVNAYVTYRREVEDMFGTAPLDMDRLRAVATKEWARSVAVNIRAMEDKDRVNVMPPGGYVDRVLSVEVDGEVARAHICWNPTGIQVLEKGKPMKGLKRTYDDARFYVGFLRSGGTWKVGAFTEEDGAC